METPIKFRNHISVVPERMGRMLVFLAALFFGSLVQNLPDLLEEARSLSEDRNTFLLSLGGILLLFLCFLGYQLLIWAKNLDLRFRRHPRYRAPYPEPESPHHCGPEHFQYQYRAESF